MGPEQINAVYQYVCQHTSGPAQLLTQMTAVGTDFNDAVDAVLYLPMYSMGMGQAGITTRIAALRAMPFTVEEAVGGKYTLHQIEHLDIGSGVQFGMPNRIGQLIRRAAEISVYGIERLAHDLAPIADWSVEQLVGPFTCVSGFPGVGYKAALHILMDLGWGVVKPDRHICRFLSRLGGQWARYFPDGETDDLLAPLMLPFVKEWRDTCAHFAECNLAAPPPRDGVIFPPLSDLTSRQIDILIMWFAQDRGRHEHRWRPAPICGEQTFCDSCSVPDCNGRAV